MASWLFMFLSDLGDCTTSQVFFTYIHLCYFLFIASVGGLKTLRGTYIYPYLTQPYLKKEPYKTQVVL